MNSAKDLPVYKKAYALSKEICSMCEKWPAGDRFSLSNQIRMSCKEVCRNLEQAWNGRMSEKYVKDRLTDAAGENSETKIWLDFALASDYIGAEEHGRLAGECRRIDTMLYGMIREPGRFLGAERL